MSHNLSSVPPPIPNPPPPNHHSLSFDFHPQPPPGFDPYLNSGGYPPNYSCFETQPSNYLENNGVSSNWVVKQAAPIKYSPAIQPLRQEAIASSSYDASNYNLIGQNLFAKVPKKKLSRPKAISKKPSVSQNVRCELCKIDCNNVHIYEKHLSGKKHAKGLQKLYAPALQAAAMHASQSGCESAGTITPGGQGTGVASKAVDLEAKKQKLLEVGTAVQCLRVCTICNVVCNGETAFADHLVGKKHLTQERARGTLMNSNPAPVSTSEMSAQSKKRKNGEPAPAWCDVCKISCTSSDGLNVHFVGKKHKKNLQKLQNSYSKTITPVSITSSLPSTNLSTEVEGNTATAETSVAGPQKAKKKGKSKEAKDFETKKRNILECGVAADAVKICTVCNVVCNSETVFKSHLAGQKHAVVVKKAEAASSSLQQAEAASSDLQQAEAPSSGPQQAEAVSTGLQVAYPAS